MKKYLLPLLIAIFATGFLVRLYRLDNPVADWHSFRQGDTNAVSTIFARDGVNLLYPRYFDISNVQSGFDNPKGYRFVEFPLYNAVQAFLFNVFGILSLAEWGRLVTILASLSSSFFIYLLTKKYAGEAAGFFGAFFHLFLPFSIFYGRSILPDPSMTAAILGGIYFFDAWLSDKNGGVFLSPRFVFAVVFTLVALLLKPFALFFTVPMIYLAFKKFGARAITKWQLWLFAILALSPLVLWRTWITQFPEGIPVSNWLFNGNGIRGRPAFFRWILYERITKLILGYTGVVFAVLGVLGVIKDKSAGFFISFAVASALYLFTIATGNVQHDYYQILVMPVVSMFAGIGADKLYNIVSNRSNKIISAAFISCLMVSSIFFSWILVRDYFNINDRGMVAAATHANQVLPKDAVVIAPYDGSTTFLNIIERPGWPVFQKSIEELIQKGASHLVIANPTQNDFNGFGRQYKPIASSSSYLILKLK